MRYPAAAVQYEPRFGEKEHNVVQLLGWTERAARAGARLIVLPEMATTGYTFRSRAEIAPYVEPVPGGPTTARFAALAARLGVYVVVALPEVDPRTDIYYNTAALIGPRGFVGKYRKLHSFIHDTQWARDGDLGLPVFETELGRIVILICMDAVYFEPARLAALAGADVVALPANWLGDPTAWYARAAENGLYVIAANRWGVERDVCFSGSSAVIDPAGSALNLLSTGDGLCLADIDPEKAACARAVNLARRRPALYQELLINTHLWRWQDRFDLPRGRTVVAATGTATGAAMADQVRWADRQVRDRGMPGLDLMLFPFDPAGTAPDGALAAVARDLNCYVAWGGPDPADGAETTWLVGPEGLTGSYRAIHPTAGIARGEEFVLLDLPWGRVGLAGGRDLAVPEMARILAKRGADLIVAPVLPGAETDRRFWNARWLENDTAVIAASTGGAAIYGSRPPAIPGAGGVLIGQVDTGSERIRAKELLRKLQPYWYTSLVTQTHP